MSHERPTTVTAEQLARLSETELALFGRAMLAALVDAELAPLLARHPEGVAVNSPADVAALLAPEMKALAQEHLRVLTLNKRHRLLGNFTLYQGTVSHVPVRPAEVFRPAVIQQAPTIIVVHNHPSGEAIASPEDIQITRTLVAAGELLGIEVLDHMIIAGEGFASLREQGRMPMHSPSTGHLPDPARGRYGDDPGGGGDMGADDDSGPSPATDGL